VMLLIVVEVAGSNVFSAIQVTHPETVTSLLVPVVCKYKTLCIPIQ